MDAEDEEKLAQFVKKWVTLDSKTQELREGYFRIEGGGNSRTSKTVAANVDWGDDLDAVYQELSDAVESAIADGLKRIYVRAVKQTVKGVGHPSGTLIIGGDPHGADPAEDRTTTGALSTAINRLSQGNEFLLTQTLGLAREFCEERVRAAIALTQIEERSRAGFHGALEGMTRELAPMLEKVLPEAIPNAMHIYLAYLTKEEDPKAVATPKGRLRHRCAMLEKQAVLLFADLNACKGALEEAAFKDEIGSRLAGLLLNAQNGLSQAFAPATPPEA